MFGLTFQVGDSVIAKQNINSRCPQGTSGVVVVAFGNYGVSFNVEPGAPFHNLHGALQQNTGYYCLPSMLSKVDEPDYICESSDLDIFLKGSAEL